MGSYDPIADSKICANCGLTRPGAAFNKQRAHGRDPYQRNCRECQGVLYRSWAEKNKSKKLAYMRGWYANNISEIKAYDAERYWRGGKKERTREIVRQNRDRYGSYSHKHRALKAGGGEYTDDDISRIKKQQRGKCAICRTKMGARYQIDHIVPLSRRGTNWPSNIQLLCGPCNVKKAATDQLIFMRRQGRLL